MFKKREGVYLNGKKVGYIERNMTSDEIDGVFKGLAILLGDGPVSTCLAGIGYLFIFGLVIARVVHQFNIYGIGLITIISISAVIFAFGLGLGFFLSTKNAKSKNGLGRIFASSMTYSFVMVFVEFLFSGFSYSRQSGTAVPFLNNLPYYAVAALAFAVFYYPLWRNLGRTILVITLIRTVFGWLNIEINQFVSYQLHIFGGSGLSIFNNGIYFTQALLVGLCIGIYYLKQE